MKPTLVCEFNPVQVRAWVVRFDRSGLDILAAAEGPSAGYAQHEFTRLGCATESVHTVVQQALKRAGESLHKVWVNLDDPQLECLRVKGTAPSERGTEPFGNIEVQEAHRLALQSMRPTDQHLIYKEPAAYLIDGRDAVANPIGVFGKELSVELQLLFSRSAQAQDLERIMQRVGLKVKRMIPSGLAAFHGILDESAREERSLLVLANEEVCHLMQTEHGALQDYRSFQDKSVDSWKEMSACAREWSLDNDPIYVTGKKSEANDWAQALAAEIGRPVKIAPCRTLEDNFQAGRFAVITGLAYLARRTYVGSNTYSPVRRAFKKVQTRTQTFLEDYF